MNRGPFSDAFRARSVSWSNSRLVMVVMAMDLLFFTKGQPTEPAAPKNRLAI